MVIPLHCQCQESPFPNVSCRRIYTGCRDTTVFNVVSFVDEKPRKTVRAEHNRDPPLTGGASLSPTLLDADASLVFTIYFLHSVSHDTLGLVICLH